MAWIYITLEQAINVHSRTIEASGGGTLGQLDMASWKVSCNIFRTMVITQPSIKS